MVWQIRYVAMQYIAMHKPWEFIQERNMDNYIEEITNAGKASYETLQKMGDINASAMQKHWNRPGAGQTDFQYHQLPGFSDRRIWFRRSLQH